MTKVVIHRAGLHWLTRDPLGPLGGYLYSKAEEAKWVAKANADGGGPMGGPRVRSGNLWRSIDADISSDQGGLVARVGTSVRSPRQNFNYPAALEQGMPSFAPLPYIDARGRATTVNTGRVQRGYHYPFLAPALQTVFSRGR